ncbi:MAG: phosphate acyltransferase PlsX [Kiritimatiellia bacterium]|jgi:glycerol-3-phosphate acyltransferase PlsX|nr:phosphate acyltransferase PlsX [Kiritimatiellia bacterium]MDP6810547.1 phosphate acyltransferase PlsX [Kiritimatiellia bacterium]MDP7024937.1 phosphate acyltransferase PlsX [Kiritimatiellia bacterium]
MRIAVDAMGGDHAPREIVRGAVDAARRLDGVTQILLVGLEDAVRAELAELGDIPSKIEVVHASQVVDMHDKPVDALRKKKDSSIARAVDLVKEGKADAVVSAGNTGAVMVSATLKLRKLEAVERPAIATVMPTQNRPFVLLDAGANTDCTPKFLTQFGVMGHVYSKLILGQESPAVGLLSIGGEEVKGNDVTRETFKLLSDSGLNFKGNVEGHDLFEGETDVVVCDGFVGNVVLKTAESASVAIGHWLKTEFKKNPIRILGAMLLSGALRTMKKRMDPESYGGAPLLGVNGVCIITHGSSSGRGIYHAIRVAKDSVVGHLNDAIVEKIKESEGQAV